MASYDHEDIDYSDLEQRYASQYVSPLDSVVILDGAPVVGPDRADKLIGAIVKSASKEAGLTVPRSAFEMPTESDGQSKGFMFVTLNNPTEAQAFQRALHEFKFDKRHTFRVVPFADVGNYEQLEETYVEPPTEEWAPREHFRAWLADPAGRDQFVLYRGDDVQIAWNNKGGAQEIAHERSRWTESYTQWSPYGTLFATIHGPGVALWGGSSFERLNRFAHPEVKLIDFSPFERYLVTWSPRPIEASTDTRGPSPFTEEDEGNQVAVWDVMTGALLRTFPMVGEPNSELNKRIVWPMFKWSPDEKYLGRVTPGQQISIYEVPSMGLLGKKSLKVDGVVDFEWSPLSDKEREAVEDEKAGRVKADDKKKAAVPIRENTIAFWTPEVQNQPARVTLMHLPSRTTIRSKNLFNVHDCKIHWQSNGDYLCVKVDRHTKTGKTRYCNLELFRVREKDCPVQVIEIKDAVTAFAWEPKGQRFVLITTADPNLGQVAPGVLLKTSVSFYGYDSRKGDFLVQKTFDNKNSNSVYWSPKGRHVLIATLGSNSKFDIDFWDLDLDREDKATENDPGAGIRLITTVEHYGLTDIEWDPSGRYVATSASTWMSSMESGYAIWDFKGVELQKHTLDKFKQFLWRPRPPTLLTRDDQKKIRKNLREYSRQFEEQDQLEASNVSSELIALRKRLIEEWNAWRRVAKDEIERRRVELGRSKKAALQRSEEAENADEVVEEWVEEVVSEVIEVVA
ncbi:translation initiation factor eIF-3b [Leucosporidium creatinivorum]|uniref:Eukaryotic translation initiation factor 3 subunit B n=1 Tax=Leucosporidium creatinivorum TaxID=106004 RepID=A0A1Y2G2N3_9BASI|nr:translation initiation factor eIF-3b [Leucosporidium creatinivorum]